jgi:hypothetical protein
MHHLQCSRLAATDPDLTYGYTGTDRSVVTIIVPNFDIEGRFHAIREGHP